MVGVAVVAAAPSSCPKCHIAELPVPGGLPVVPVLLFSASTGKEILPLPSGSLWPSPHSPDTVVLETGLLKQSCLPEALAQQGCCQAVSSLPWVLYTFL